MQAVTKESARLQAEHARIEREIVDAAVAHSQVFTAAHDANDVAASVLGDIAARVADLDASLALLQGASGRLVAAGQAWRRDKAAATNAVAHHQKLVELLEAPQTLDVCVRSDMHHEALLVAEHVAHLCAEHPELPALQRLHRDVAAQLRRLVHSVVLPRMAAAMPLAHAIKLTTFLARLGVPPPQLRALFLARRADFIGGLARDAEALSHSPYSHLSKLTTVYKVHVAETVTQFAACFPSATAGDSEGGGDGPLFGELAAWAHGRAAHFVAAFRAHVQHVVSGVELASLAEQCANCGAATAKVGLDVTPLLSELLAARVRQLVATQIAAAAAAYAAAMAAHVWKVPLVAHAAPAKPAAAAAAATSADALAPPAVLLQVLPLAYAMNGALTACNDIRKCCARSVAGACVDELGDLAARIARDLARVRSVSAAAMDPAEQQALAFFVDAFADAFVPHLVRCVERLFPQTPFLGRALEARLAGEIAALRAGR